MLKCKCNNARWWGEEEIVRNLHPLSVSHTYPRMHTVSHISLWTACAEKSLRWVTAILFKCLFVCICVCVCMYYLPVWVNHFILPHSGMCTFVFFLFIYQTICSCCISHTHFPRILNLMPNLTTPHHTAPCVPYCVSVCKFLEFKNSSRGSSQQNRQAIRFALLGCSQGAP